MTGSDVADDRPSSATAPTSGLIVARTTTAPAGHVTGSDVIAGPDIDERPEMTSLIVVTSRDRKYTGVPRSRSHGPRPAGSERQDRSAGARDEERRDGGEALERDVCQEPAGRSQVAHSQGLRLTGRVTAAKSVHTHCT